MLRLSTTMRRTVAAAQFTLSLHLFLLPCPPSILHNQFLQFIQLIPLQTVLLLLQPRNLVFTFRGRHLRDLLSHLLPFHILQFLFLDLFGTILLHRIHRFLALFTAHLLICVSDFDYL